ncbi:MAG: FixH family protein [Bacteroidetes bacterium]|nr:FixH family protein [Bacteroidota bacterium]
MKTKWNWGTKLALWTIAFMSFLIILVYMTFKNDIILVEKDYYPKGIQYQTRIDEMANARLENVTFSVSQNETELVVYFPGLVVDSGTLFFFRPSDNNMDRVYHFSQSDSNQMHLPIQQFSKGKYLLKSQWSFQGKKFYIEKPIYIK